VNIQRFGTLIGLAGFLAAAAMVAVWSFGLSKNDAESMMMCFTAPNMGVTGYCPGGDMFRIVVWGGVAAFILGIIVRLSAQKS